MASSFNERNINQTSSYCYGQSIRVLWSPQEHILRIGGRVHHNRERDVLLGMENNIYREWSESLPRYLNYTREV